MSKYNKKLTLIQMIKYLWGSQRHYYYTHFIQNEQKSDEFADQLDWYWYSSSKNQKNFLRYFTQYISYCFWEPAIFLKEKLYEKKTK